jgi:hypothetical protein
MGWPIGEDRASISGSFANADGGRCSGSSTHPRNTDVTSDERFHHVALPKLYGAPATSARNVTVAHSPRPFDPDDLPIEAQQTEEERELLSALPPKAFAPGGGHVSDATGGGQGAQASGSAPTRPREFSLRSIAGRFISSQDEDSGAA